MSLNVENLFVKCGNKVEVLDLVDAYWRSPAPPRQPDWGLPSSFAQLLADQPKRRLAVSPPRDGWIALVESKEVIDFALANALSEKLRTSVLAIQISEAVGAAGYASVEHGRLVDSQFSEEDEHPIATIRIVLKKYRVPFDATLFGEAAQRVSDGWSLIHAK